jgi:two-component system, LuxR family, response regulator FixJ
MTQPIVYVVDDDLDLGLSLARLLRRQGYATESFVEPRQVLDVYQDAPAHCVVTDVMMDDLDGFAFAEKLRALDPAVSIVFMTAWPTTAHAVDSIRRYGGLDYLEKPLDQDRLLAAMAEGTAWSEARRVSASRIAPLTRREREVFDFLVRGYSNKAIANALGVSVKTIEDHRASVIAKTGAKSVADLVRLVEDMGTARRP